MTTNLPHIQGRLLGLLDQTGATDLVGGRHVFIAGMKQIQAGLLQVGTDILVAQAQEVDLADAVFDLERFPNLARAHGLVRDFLDLRLPAEVLPWAERTLSADLPEDAVFLRRMLVEAALDEGNPVWAGIARFVLFEALCINQRMLLKAERVHLETLDGDHDAVEVLAEREVDAVLALPSEAVCDAEDPFEVLVACALTSLEGYVEDLCGALADTTDSLSGKLAARQSLIELMEGLPMEDVVLLRNEAGMDGETRTIKDLQRLRPLLLGGQNENTLHQRAGRARKKLREGRGGRSGTTLADLLLRAIDGGEE